MRQQRKNTDIPGFHKQCQDLFKCIQKRIIKKYVCPYMSEIKIMNTFTLRNIKYRGRLWEYYNTKERLSDEDKIIDIFKDNRFLSLVQKCYESIEAVIIALDDNERNVQFTLKNMEANEKAYNMLSKLNGHLNQIFQKNGKSFEKYSQN